MTTMNPAKMTAPIVALYDLMMDGNWHGTDTLITHGASICAEAERDAALKNGRRVRRAALAAGKQVTDADLIASGAKDIVRNRLMIAVRGGRMEKTATEHRMTEQARTAWQAARGTALVAPTSIGTTNREVAAAIVAHEDTLDTYMMDEDAPSAYASTNIFGGIPEGQGWARAPRHLKDRVHFRLKFEALPVADFRAAMPADADVSYDEQSGLCRVDVAHGTGSETYTLIAEWCADNGYETKGLRIQPDIRRRTMADLDQTYLADLCEYYHRYCRGQVRKHASTLKVHFNDPADQSQQVYEWILEAIAAYDETSGVPFGAFLVTKVQGWVHDLNRIKWGRHISEQEMRQQRARNAFSSENGREPNEFEMAAMLNQSIEVYREKAGDVANLRGLRAASPLVGGGEDGDSEIALPDEARVEDRHEAAMRQSMVTQMLTKACSVDKDARGKLAKTPNILGWVTTYETTWRGKSKVALAGDLGTSTRNMSQYTERAQERMRALAGELLER